MYRIKVKQILSKDVFVDAVNEDEAMKAFESFSNDEMVLEGSDLVFTGITIKGKDEFKKYDIREDSINKTNGNSHTNTKEAM